MYRETDFQNRFPKSVSNKNPIINQLIVVFLKITFKALSFQGGGGPFVSLTVPK